MSILNTSCKENNNVMNLASNHISILITDLKSITWTINPIY